MEGNNKNMTQKLDEIFGNIIGEGWSWKKEDNPEFYSISNGRLRLNAIAVEDKKIENIPNLLTKKITGDSVDIKAKLKLKLKNDGDRVGISIYNSKCYSLRVEKYGDKVYMKQSNYDKNAVDFSDETVVYSSKIRDEGDFYLEIKISADNKITFFFGYSADDIYKLGFSSDYDSSEEINLGIFCINAEGKQSDGYVKFEYIRFI